MTSQANIRWTRLAAEGIAIVISILLAFAIDAWWANRVESIEEAEILRALQREFEINLVTLDAQLAYRDAVRASANRILQAAAGEIRLEPAEFDRLLGDILWTGWLDLSTGALASLLQSGKLSLIKNRMLSEHLAGLPYWLDNTAKLEEFELRRLDADLFPFLSEHAYLPQIYNTFKGQPSTGDFPNPAVLPTSETRDHTYLLENQKFVGMISIEHNDHNDAIWGYGTLKEKLKAAIRMIESELAGRE
jgi:hypothetical protein